MHGSKLDLQREIAELQALCTELRDRAAAAASMPPRPSTFRGFLGSILVRFVRRSLFWFFPANQQFQAYTADGMERVTVLLNAMRLDADRTRTEYRDLAAGFTEMRAALVSLQRSIAAQEKRMLHALESGLRTEHRSRVSFETHVEAELDRVGRSNNKTCNSHTEV